MPETPPTHLILAGEESATHLTWVTLRITHAHVHTSHMSVQITAHDECSSTVITGILKCVMHLAHVVPMQGERQVYYVCVLTLLKFNRIEISFFSMTDKPNLYMPYLSTWLRSTYRKQATLIGPVWLHMYVIVLPFITKERNQK